MDLSTRLKSLLWRPTVSHEHVERRSVEDEKTQTDWNDHHIVELGLKMKDEAGTPASFGDVRFHSVTEDGHLKKNAPAKFACLADDTDVTTAARLLTECWKLRRPSVLLSITGSAQVRPYPPSRHPRYITRLTGSS